MSKRGIGLEQAEDKRLARERRSRERAERVKERRAKRSERLLIKKERRESFNSVAPVLGIVLLVLLVVVLIRRFKGVNSYPTFTGFLEYFTNIKAPSIPFLSEVSNGITADWGWFNFFRDFLNGFMSIVDVLIFFVNGLISVVSYIVIFFNWLFAV